MTVDASALKVGDYAGLCALQGCYGMIAVARRSDGFYVVMRSGQRFPAGDAGGRRRGDGMGGSARTAGNCTFKNRSGVCRDAG